MALLPLGPASAAPPVAPPAPSLRQDAGMTVGGMREVVSVVREFVSLWKDVEPILKAMRPPQPEIVEDDPRMRPPLPARAPAPEVAEAVESAPPRSEVDAGRREEAEKARAELQKLVNERLTKPQILQLAAAFGPLAIAEKMPKLADALAAHAAETDAWLSVFSEEELKAVLCEVLPLIPQKDVAMARAGLMQAVQAFEQDAKAGAAPPQADEPKKDGEGA